jgi:AcrR family transcriptional regulator
MVKTSVQTKKVSVITETKAGGRAQRIDGQSTREAILAATFRRVVSDGYAQLNVREIAREAGVNHALINYHFRNKQQLVLEVLDQANRRLLARQQKMYAQPDTVSDQWFKACEFYEEDLRSGFVKLMMELMAASFSDPVLRAEYLPRFLAWRRVVDGAVADAVKRHGLELPIESLAISTLIGCFWIGMEAEMALGIPETDGHHRLALDAILALLRSIENRPVPIPSKRAQASKARATAKQATAKRASVKPGAS